MACEHGSDPSPSNKTWNFLTSYVNNSFAKKVWCVALLRDCKTEGIWFINDIK